MKDAWIGSAILLATVLATATNERRLVRHMTSLEEGLKHVVSLPEPVAAAQNEGRLVHFSGVITTDPAVLSADDKASRTPYVLDPAFGIAARGVRLFRTVEMLQWVETAHTIVSGGNAPAGDDETDGGVDEHREKTYTYDLRWRSDRVDSMSFHDMSYHNPSEDAWVFQSKVVDVDAVVVGDFKLSEELIDQINRRDAIQLDTKNRQTMGIVLDQRLGKDWNKVSALKDVSIEDDYFYLLRGGSGRPRLGDIRVSFKVAPAYPVTVSGKQVMQHIRPFETKAGEPILILEDGIHSAAELYDSKLATKYRHNRFYRLFTSTLGFLAFLVLYPTLAVRFGRDFASVQKHLVCVILGGGATFSVVGLVWLLHRPLWALVLAGGGLSPTLALATYVRSIRARRVAIEAKTQ